MGWKDLFRSLWIKDTEMEKYMFLIVGLGNPGKQYEHTRHNIGFDVMDALAEKYNISISEKKHKALCGKGVINGVKVVLAKPQTYMNLSGESVAELVNYYKMDPEEEMIVMTSALRREICASAKKEVRVGTMESKISLR